MYFFKLFASSSGLLTRHTVECTFAPISVMYHDSALADITEFFTLSEADAREHEEQALAAALIDDGAL